MPHNFPPPNLIAAAPRLLSVMARISQFVIPVLAFSPLHQDSTTKRVLLRGPCHNGLYSISSSTSPANLALLSVQSVPDLWHGRLGHPDTRKLQRLAQLHSTISSKITSKYCNTCNLAKSHRLPSSISFSVTVAPFEIVHSDVWGPSPTISLNGFRYFVTFIDEHTKYCWVYPLIQKSDVFAKFQEFYNMIRCQFNKHIKTLRTDGGGEFINNSFNQFCKNSGMRHQYSCPHTPSQNGIAERKNRHILETIRSLLIHSKAPQTLWTHALHTAIHIINRLPTRTLENKTPYESLFRIPPSYDHLKIFGCLCYPWLRPYAKSKLESFSKPCVFIGYPPTQKGYLCLDPVTNHIYTSRHVVFNEQIFPYHQNSSTIPNSNASSTIPPLLLVPSSLLSPQVQHLHTTYTTPQISQSQSTHPNHVCKLNKALYGLKQSPRQWFATLTGFLHTQGFRTSHSDPSLMICQQTNIQIYFLIYVDDLIVTGNNKAAVQTLLNNLHNRFNTRYLGQLSQFLGITAIPQPDGLLLHQSRYATSILQRAGMTNCKPTATPITAKSHISPQISKPFFDPLLYRQLVGSLQYLTLTRPDITYAVNKACQFMHQPTDINFDAVKRILRYIKGTINYGLPLSGNSFTLTSFVDSDWAGDQHDRKSTTGYCTFLGRSPVNWCVKKQSTIARSSTEAEYRALAAAAVDLTWTRQLLQELGRPQTNPTQLFCDNTSAIALANNPVFHARTKHIEVDCHYIRECIKNKSIQVHHISTKDQLADIFTKALSTIRFRHLAHKLISPHTSSVCKGVLNQSCKPASKPD
ncbi:Retrovirus-related Pol polyprotein from transposon TNT 1-94 [Dendrobium catenatum]|uniref:Retrovirus-related Pol polyprotein from transposon TNT 1-94 n=1 Tax=Dendrobium catenatum TaxID=906689 RepID=A0A2I0VRW8_9ASPA|nr:Retrovirus-related Pol polyprotein from transposon TNT 1-94 [Dendrobium catenatum]